MSGTNLHSVYRRTARAAAKQRIVKNTTGVDVDRARVDFAYFCDVVADKPPAEHHLEWHKYLCSGVDTECLLGIGGPNIDILAPRGPLDPDTLVATPTGWVKLKDLSVGDMVYGDDGVPTTILNTLDYEESELFEVVFSDGTTMRCDDSHKIDVRLMGTDPKGVYRTITLQEIRTFVTTGSTGNWKTGVKRTVRVARPGEKPWLDTRGFSKYQVPIASAVQYEEKNLPIHPYVLGVLLGDGNLTTAAIKFTTADEDIAILVNDLLDDDLFVVDQKESHPYEYAIQHIKGKKAPCISGKAGGHKKQIAKDLVDLKLTGKKSIEKHIPESYLFSSIKQRTWLLKGLMDTDGTVRQNCDPNKVNKTLGGLKFGSSSKKLIDDVSKLVRSLGGIVTTNKPYYPHYYAKDEQGNRIKIVSENLAYRIGIRLPEEIEPFYCKRKAEKYFGPCSKRSNSGLVRAIVDIRSVGHSPVRCIEVDNPQHRFVIENYVVSNNSAKSSILGLFTAWTIGVHALHKKPLKILYISYTVDVARPKSAAIKRIIEENKMYKEIFPTVKIAKGINSNEYWSIDWKFAGIRSTGEEEFTLCCAGLKGAVTSKRSHLCLTGDTLVHTQRGPVSIHDIYQTPGDYQVHTYNPRTGRLEWSSIQGVSRRLTKGLIHVETSSGDILRATPEHPFYIPGKGIIPASDLQAGDSLIDIANLKQGSKTFFTETNSKSKKYVMQFVQHQQSDVTCKTTIRQEQLSCPSHQRQPEEQRLREFNHLVQALSYKLPSNGTESQDTRTTITKISKISDRAEYVYDLETESENHNFFAGESGYCVANCIIDDPIKSSDDIKNRDIRAAMEDNWNSVITPTMFEGGRAVCLGTRFRHDDIHATTFTPQNDWVQIVQSAITIDEQGDEISYWPAMWSLEYLQDRKRQAPVSFSFQYQNQIVQTSDLAISPDLIVKGQISTHFDSMGIGVDLSAGLKERNDYTVFVLGGRVADKIHVIDCKRIRIMGNLEKIEALMEMCYEWGIVHKDGDQYYPTGSHVDIWSEAVAYQASLEADFRRICQGEHSLYNISWHPVKGFKGDKVARFRGIMGLFEQRKIVFNKYRRFVALSEEIINFGVSSHDDCVDALIWMVNGLITRGKLELEY